MVLKANEELKRGVCFSISPIVDRAIVEKVKEGVYRNKSDFIERAAKYFLEHPEEEYKIKGNVNTYI